MSHPDPYRVLGISSRASLDEAQDAYHRLLRREHPDLHHRAGPERVGRAEQRTRDLNAAISSIRDAETVRSRSTSGVRSPSGGPAGPGGPEGTTPPHGANAAVDGGGVWDDHENRWTVPPVANATAPCPWCGEQFERGVDLKDHVLVTHDLRVDRRVRGGLFGGRIRRRARAAGHLPLWGVLPVNIGTAAILATLVAVPTDETVGRWVFALAMTPSIVALVDRLFDASG